MSEELLQTTPHKLGRYEYYVLGSTTLTQLKKKKVIPNQVPANLASKKPDGLIVAPHASVKAVIEYKTPTELSSKAKQQAAINQEIAVAKHLCKLLIVSDGDNSYWINSLTGAEITNEDGTKLEVFSAKRILEGKLTQEEILKLEDLLDKIDYSLSETNNAIAAPSLVDPSLLAKAIWQKIWINTGREPEKCLYNVVELFVFKFLSDVGVLKTHNNFDSIYSLTKTAGKEAALKHYAQVCRRDIKELFPVGSDGTTIINGTIFVNERGEPNSAQSRLFSEVVGQLQEYAKKNGSFKYMQREFKTRLYESFLRQEAGIRFLGQYFTPRNVVQAMVRMSTASLLRAGARIGDPFCGVGGFLLETIALNPNIYREFEPSNGVVKPAITLKGYDKGTNEKDDERTIILAKANMLIYFSDLLARYNSPEYLQAFSQSAFNSVFQLLRSNLGTFARVGDEPFDLILTNPPYVTSGSNSLKRAIDDEGLSDSYTSGGRGTESLALEWVVRNLKSGGTALVVVPDGLLNQSAMLDFLKRECFIRGVVSLPSRTFYSTPKKTYIVCLERKHSPSDIQTDPVFAYVVSEIGESRDAKRFKIEENDLTEVVALYNQFKGSPPNFKSTSARCKVFPSKWFAEKGHWMVDRWWDEEERTALGMTEEPSEVSEDEFHGSIRELQTHLSAIETDTEPSTEAVAFHDIPLSDERYFTLMIGKRVLKKDILASGIPIYSANVAVPFGHMEKSNLVDFSRPALLWGIDGIYDWGFIPAGNVFASTDHCGVLTVLEDTLLPKYVYYALRASKDQYGFDRTYRANLANIKEVVRLRVPVKADGEFDIEAQNRIIKKYERLEQIQRTLREELTRLASLQIVLDRLD